MSQENVEIVKAAYDAWNAGDRVAMYALYDPWAIRVRGLEECPEESEPLVGRKAVMRMFEHTRDVWGANAVELISFIDAGDRVVVRHVWRGVGDGTESELEWTIVYTLRKGKIFLLEQFWDHAEALETLALSE